ncbi:hypothetical protein RJT34_06196 [Clitoria ternatea]|uniref:Uncharacterized protein n=1 Tax=Clitoria ternatea TaxID=43366 RepID=A0AAN9PTF9_CLITE
MKKQKKGRKGRKRKINGPSNVMDHNGLASVNVDAMHEVEEEYLSEKVDNGSKNGNKVVYPRFKTEDMVTNVIYLNSENPDIISFIKDVTKSVCGPKEQPLQLPKDFVRIWLDQSKEYINIFDVDGNYFNCRITTGSMDMKNEAYLGGAWY